MNVQLRAGIKSPLGSLKHTAPVGKESSAEDGRMLACFQCFFPSFSLCPHPSLLPILTPSALLRKHSKSVKEGNPSHEQEDFLPGGKNLESFSQKKENPSLGE